MPATRMGAIIVVTADVFTDEVVQVLLAKHQKLFKHSCLMHWMTRCVKKSQAQRGLVWVLMKYSHEPRERLGEVSMPSSLRMLRTVCR